MIENIGICLILLSGLSYCAGTINREGGGNISTPWALCFVQFTPPPLRDQNEQEKQINKKRRKKETGEAAIFTQSEKIKDFNNSIVFFFLSL